MKVYKLTEEKFVSLKLERLYDTEWCGIKSYYDIGNTVFNDNKPITYFPYLMAIEDGCYFFTHRRNQMAIYLLKHRGELIVIDDTDEGEMEISMTYDMDEAIIHDALLDSSIEDMVGYLRLILSL